MTMQAFTTYDQSLRLKELGLPQDLNYDEHGGDVGTSVFYWGLVDEEKSEREGGVQVREGLAPFLARYVPQVIGSDQAMLCRALSRQEIEDYLMERYAVRINQMANSLLEDDSFACDVWLKVPGDDNREIVAGKCNGRDPFPALYDALVWSLEQGAVLPPHTSTTPQGT